MLKVSWTLGCLTLEECEHGDEITLGTILGQVKPGIVDMSDLCYINARGIDKLAWYMYGARQLEARTIVLVNPSLVVLRALEIWKKYYGAPLDFEVVNAP